MTVRDYWNHNVAHHDWMLRAAPEECRAALDVGCGDGMLAVKLAARAKRVVGIDLSAEMVELARARARAGDLDVEIVQGDFLAAVREGVLPRRSFDFVCSVATLHHMDFEAGLRAMAELVAPGGRLVVVGHAVNRSVWEWLVAGAGLPVVRAVRMLHGGKGGPAGLPVKDPHMSWRETREASLRVLPDARWRRRLHLRYSIEWSAPAAAEALR